jgi:cytochrome c556
MWSSIQQQNTEGASMRTFTRTILTIGSAIALTAGTALSVSADDEDAIKYRQSVMKANGGLISGAVAIIKGKVPYKDDLVPLATGLNEAAKAVPNAFKEKTSGGDTRAKPEIWEDAGDFQQKVKDLQSATADFLAAAKSGGPEAAGAKLGAVGDACTACHKKFRAKKS